MHAAGLVTQMVTVTLRVTTKDRDITTELEKGSPASSVEMTSSLTFCPGISKNIKIMHLDSS